LLNTIKISVAAGAIALFFTGCSFLSPGGPSGPTNARINNSKSVQQATMRPYVINGKTYYPTVVNVGDKASGIASWYGPDFHGKKTSNGEIYNMHNLTAAHKTLPMNTMVKVTHVNNGKTVIVRINDRGPFVAGRVIDLSKAAATSINMIGTGTAPVKLEVVGFNGNINDKTIASESLAYKSQSPKAQGSLYGGSKGVAQDSVIGGEFMVQIGAFKNISGANIYKKQYAGASANYQTIVKSFELDEGKIYRVFLTGFRSEDEARDFIAAGHIDGAFFVRE
jgi:hypothetical protein